MSIQVGSPKMFSRLHTKALFMSYNTTVNINYSQTLRGIMGYYGDQGIKNLVKTLCDLNEESYTARYEPKTTELVYSSFIDWNTFDSMNIYQFLKSLYFTQYNIEKSTILERRKTLDLNGGEIAALKQLASIIADVESAIISELPEYKVATWSLDE